MTRFLLSLLTVCVSAPLTGDQTASIAVAEAELPTVMVGQVLKSPASFNARHVIVIGAFLASDASFWLVDPDTPTRAKGLTEENLQNSIEMCNGGFDELGPPASWSRRIPKELISALKKKYPGVCFAATAGRIDTVNKKCATFDKAPAVIVNNGATLTIIEGTIPPLIFE